MKKIILSTITLWGFGCGFLNAGTMGSLAAQEYNWNGYYIGANAGYWWSQNNTVKTNGTPSFINPLFPEGAEDIANALAVVGTNSISSTSEGFIGGGQAGYNHLFQDKFIAGIDADIEGLAESQSATSFKNVPLANFPENYTSTLTVSKHPNWLGTVRGKLGVLMRPSIMLYGAGGFAYGDASLNELFVASESLGAPSYPKIATQNNLVKFLTGWSAGVGIEWMFKPQCSAKIEYSYYDLGTLSSNVTITQMNNLGVTPVPWGSANVYSSAQIAAGSVRVGLNYHFA